MTPVSIATDRAMLLSVARGPITTVGIRAMLAASDGGTNIADPTTSAASTLPRPSLAAAPS
jgi:hypothetical protein